jgi:membrane-associated protein
MHEFLDLFLHLRAHVGDMIQMYGTAVYAIFFAIIFIETGVVVWPWLPGDSLLFTAGAFAAMGQLNPFLMFGLLASAAVLGDTTNYWIGHMIGPKVFKWKKSRFFNPEALQRTHNLYETYGGKFIIMARFIPIVRTYAPFFAGVGAMTYRRFIVYCVCAAMLWVGVCLSAGYLFGNIPWVAKNFEVVIMGIILVSVLPMVIEYIRHRNKATNSSRGRSGRR